ncbi:protein of unknown function (plasmid) [Methylocella tundrae]|uniref:Uncharacterized protein n=1 Tax=Methylocella tundrae TaxID=227605 RepID=A0A4U8Z8D5_METTU|nr:protein of unknown function [Methylocella tundrae]
MTCGGDRSVLLCCKSRGFSGWTDRPGRRRLRAGYKVAYASIRVEPASLILAELALGERLARRRPGPAPRRAGAASQAQ